MVRCSADELRAELVKMEPQPDYHGILHSIRLDNNVIGMAKIKCHPTAADSYKPKPFGGTATIHG